MTRAFSWACGPRSALAVGLGALVLGGALAGDAFAGPAVLPVGGKVVAGAASVGAPAGFSLTIDQTSPKAIIDWTTFSIGKGARVTFDNGAGITLNRVMGGQVSDIDGTLFATGGVYVLNPNGVVIGRNGVVNVGGDFVASSLALSNQAFLAGGDLSFASPTGGPVTNLGYIVSASGSVELIGPQAANGGEIEASQGDVGLGAGEAVVLHAQDAGDGRLSVLVGGPGASAANTGLIRAAEAELRANGGDIYALAVNRGTGIDVTGVSSKDGNVWLIADGGDVTATGAIFARRADGAGGLVETSGESVDFDGLKVDAGEWLIDPVTLTVDAAAASTISSNLATTNVDLQTTATSASGPGVQSSGAGDIIIDAPISWSSGKSLTLDAYHSIDFDADVTVAGGGQVILKTDDGGTGGAYSFAPGASLGFASQTGANGQPEGLSGQALIINGAAYTLVYSEAGLLAVNNNLAGDYAVAAPLSLQGYVFTASPIARDVSNQFTGVLDGLGNAITGLSIDEPIPDPQTLDGLTWQGSVGLIGVIGAAGLVRDVTLAGANVVGGDTMRVGALAGLDLGTVANSTSSGSVAVGDTLQQPNGTAAEVGGLVGSVRDGGQILDSESSADVSGGNAVAGGLVGSEASASLVSGSSASGAVATGATNAVQDAVAGGLAGVVDGQATNDYATGAVSGGAGSLVGGFVGYAQGAAISDSYATGAVTQTAFASGFADWAGGFVGFVSGGSLTQSYASGSVSTVGGAATATTTAGGFVAGEDASASISNSYALGSVTASGSSVSNVGGFAGVVEGDSTASDVYATGKLTGGGGLGGVASQVGNSQDANGTGGSISDAYWDEGTTGTASGYTLGGTGSASGVAGIGGATGASPYQSASYGGFDFSGVWYLIPGETRPILRSEYSTTIVNAHQLQLIALDPGAAYTLGADIDASETASPFGVWNPANGFVPVGGNGAADFSGQLDGDGFSIANLTIIDTAGSAQALGPYELNGFVGLFGVLGPTASVQDLSIDNASVTGGNGMSVGILAGAVQGSVTDVTTAGAVAAGAAVELTISGQQSFSPALAGGLAGVVEGGGAIANSQSSASASAGVESGAGGLIGALLDGASLTDSSASGGASTAGGTASQFGAAGGLVAAAGADLPGGGTPAQVTITGSSSTGSVTGGPYTTAGGLAGLVQQASISGSYAAGAVQVNGTAEAGGFVGELQNAEVSDSYATGAVSMPTANATPGALGGFAGAVIGASTIDNAWSSGGVSADGSSSGTNYLGGFAGYLGAGSSIADAYSLGAVTVLAAGSTVTGGFAGEDGGAIATFYATGAVNTVANGSTAGGLIGALTGSASDGYWDEGTTGQMTAVAAGAAGTNLVGIGGATGLSPYAASTYANFDLANTWYIIGGETRPILRSEYATTITDAHQLELMALDPGADYTLANNIGAGETSSIYGVWNPANGFVPVGTAAAPFTGTLNGQGFTVSNLDIVVAQGAEQSFEGLTTDGFAGLLGVVNGPSALIENINLARLTVEGGDGTEVGGLAGALLQGTIQNASSSGEVVGGDALIDGAGDPINAAVGGLVGIVGPESAAGPGASIAGSSSTAGVAAGDAFAGGLVGSTLTGASITGSWASGAVAAGSTTGTAGEIAEAGGLVGSLSGATVSASYATGPVVGSGGSSVGGFAGYVGNSQVSDSYSTGPVGQSGTSFIFSNYAGGFAGYVDTGSTIAAAFASGQVSTVGSGAAPPTFAGGFAGYLNGSVGQAYATGAVASTGPADNVGGFAGEIDAGAVVNQVYATGAVTGAGSVGGLAGQLVGALSNSYWDEGTTGQSAGFVGSGGVATTVVGMGGSTGVSPFQAATYAGWDFSQTWSQPSAGEYPELLGVSHVLEVVGGADTSVYGQYPVYTYQILGVQDADIQYTTPITEAPSGVASSTSGWIDVGTYALDPAKLTAIGASGPYRSIYVAGALTVTTEPITATLTGAVDKTYDGTTDATISDADLSLSGVVTGDIVSATVAGGSYATKNAGTGIEVTTTGLALTGADAANYTVNGSASGAVGEIDPLALTATLVGAATKAYDGNTTATLTSANYQLSGVIGGDAVSLNDPTTGTYATGQVGTGITVTVGGLALTGANASDYTVNASASAPIGVIAAAAPSVTPGQVEIQVIAPTEVDLIDQPLIPAPPEDAAAIAADFAAATGLNGEAVNPTAYTVFPVTQGATAGVTGEGSSVTGAGNGDLWVGSNLDPDQSCPSGDPDKCKKGASQ